MDLALVKKKINEGKYKSIHDAADDVRMIWKNCMTYNADGSDFYNLAQVSGCVVVLFKFMRIWTHLMSTFSHIPRALYSNRQWPRSLKKSLKSYVPKMM